MAFDPPALDDRSFQDLVQEVLARVPAHVPEWTPRQGDPGRTIVELFAWLADTILYRANLIPERQRLVFLRLLGMQMRPAIPARGLVSVSIADEQATSAVTIRPLARVSGKAPVAFETLSVLTVLPVTAEAYYKRKLSNEERDALDANLLAGLQEVYQVPQVEPYVTTRAFEGQAGPQGLELHQQTADRCLWLALLAPDEALVAEIRKTLGQSSDGGQQVINVGIEPAIAVPDLFEDIGPRARIPFLWEITGVRESGGRQRVEYTRLELLEDTTAGLTRRGVQRLLLPAERFIGAATNDVRRDFRAGVGDVPPRLDDAGRDRRLVAWLRLRPVSAKSPSVLPPRLALGWVGINAVEIDARQTAGPRIIGQSDGSPGQQMQLPGQSVDPASLVLQVETPGHGFQPWRQIDDLAFAGRDEPVYRLESDTGTIELGDGLRGHIPPAGMRVRVAQLRAGGGRAGNLAAGTLEEIRAVQLDGKQPPKLKLTQPVPTIGGQDSESLAAAEQRIPAMLRHRNRAVTADDYRQLAIDTPAVSIGRVEVLPRFKPHQRRSGVAGAVSVMVLPEDFRLAPPNPRPDRPLLEAVHEYLGQRRPLGTELYVIGCEYVQIGVSIGVTVRDGFAREEVLQSVRQAIRSQLWPLRPHGPHGEGWPLGQSVRDRELEVAVARVPGVSGLIEPGMNLFQRNPAAAEGADQWRKVARPHPNAALEIGLQPWQLPELMSVVAVIDQPPPDELLGTPNPFASEAAVAVPVVPEVC